MIVGPEGGATDIPAIVGEFRYNETSSGGLQSISGRITAKQFRTAPHVYKAGADWYVFRAETGELDLWGELTAPNEAGDVVNLNARGPAYRLDKELRSRLYQSRSYADWTPADSEPHSYSVTKKIDVNIKGGRIKFRPQGDATFSGSEKNGALFWAPGEHISRIAFTRYGSDDSAGWELVLYGANTDNDGLGASLTEVTSWSLTTGSVAGTDIDYSITSGDYDLVGLYLRKNGAGTPSDPPRYWVRKLRINGVADDDEFTASDVVRDLLAELNIGDEEVQENGTAVLPLWIKDTTYRDALDYICLITGWRLIVRKTYKGLTADFGPWTTRTWTLVDQESPRDLTPMERFNRVPVEFKWAAGNATDVVTATADPDPLEDINLAPTVQLPDHQPNRDQAEVIAQRLADFLAEERFNGSVTLLSVLDEQGVRQPAQVVRAGDTLYIPEIGRKLKIDTLEGNEETVTVRFLDTIPFVERIAARRRRRFAVRGR